MNEYKSLADSQLTWSAKHTEFKVQSNLGFASFNGPRKRFEATVYLYIGKVKKWGVWISVPETEVPEVFEEIAGWPEGCWGRVKKVVVGDKVKKW